MGSRNAAGWDTPTIFLLNESCFRLSAGETKLPSIARQAPGGVILAESAKSPRHFRCVDPLDAIFCTGFQCV